LRHTAGGQSEWGRGARSFISNPLVFLCRRGTPESGGGGIWQDRPFLYCISLHLPCAIRFLCCLFIDSGETCTTGLYAHIYCPTCYYPYFLSLRQTAINTHFATVFAFLFYFLFFKCCAQLAETNPDDGHDKDSGAETHTWHIPDWGLACNKSLANYTQNKISIEFESRFLVNGRILI
jgi:hypothetical protein